MRKTKRACASVSPFFTTIMNNIPVRVNQFRSTKIKKAGEWGATGNAWELRDSARAELTEWQTVWFI